MSTSFHRTRRFLRDKEQDIERILSRHNLDALKNALAAPTAGSKKGSPHEALESIEVLQSEADEILADVPPVALLLMAAQLEKEYAAGAAVSLARLYNLRRANPVFAPPVKGAQNNFQHIVPFIEKYRADPGGFVLETVDAAGAHAMRAQSDWWLDPKIESQFHREDWEFLLQSFAAHLSPTGLYAEAKYMEDILSKRQARSAQMPTAQAVHHVWLKALRAEADRRIDKMREVTELDFENFKSWPGYKKRLANKIYSTADDLKKRDVSIAAQYLYDYAHMDEAVPAVSVLSGEPSAFEKRQEAAELDLQKDLNSFRSHFSSFAGWEGPRPKARVQPPVNSSPNGTGSRGRFNLFGWLRRDERGAKA